MPRIRLTNHIFSNEGQFEAGLEGWLDNEYEDDLNDGKYLGYCRIEYKLIFKKIRPALNFKRSKVHSTHYIGKAKVGNTVQFREVNKDYENAKVLSLYLDKKADLQVSRISDKIMIGSDNYEVLR